jgi:histidyl-tRNA synthetase
VSEPQIPASAAPRDAAEIYRAPIGTHDVLAPESDRFAHVVVTFAERAARYGFGLVLTPMFEHLEVFQRVGESTDVVRKEMYDFTDKGGRHLVLRPEGTAAVVRAYVQHRPTPPWKAFYVAPNFRYERPQKGRYRQHWQVGAEVLGVDDAEVDVEVIALASGFFAALGLTRVRLLLNSMGDETSRPAYRAALQTHLRPYAAELGETFAELVELNPLRTLDSKNPAWQVAIEGAPKLADHLGPESAEHFARVCGGLDELGIAYELAPRLVRGFDYYTRTTFEFAADALDSAQNAIGGGGRYDKLAEEMGGPATPGIGFGIGIERVTLALEAELGSASPSDRLDAFAIDAVDGVGVLRTVEGLRAAGLRIDRAYGGRSVKAQWKAADRSGATFGLMFGRDEAARDAVGVKHMHTGEQVEVPVAQLAHWLTEHRVIRGEHTP